MAAVYTMGGDVLTEGLQGSSVCNDAARAARRIAKSRGEPVLLTDDDGEWVIPPDDSDAVPHNLQAEAARRILV